MEAPVKYPKLLAVLPDYPEDERKKKPAWRQKETHGDEYNAMVTEISVRLERAGFSMNKARSYVRQAIAAYPDEQNLDILFGCAISLLHAKEAA